MGDDEGKQESNGSAEHGLAVVLADLKALLTRLDVLAREQGNDTGGSDDTGFPTDRDLDQERLPEVIERERRRSVFESYRRCADEFLPNEWVVVVMFFRDGMSDREIGEQLGISAKAVNERRRRARIKRDRRERELRLEAYRESRRYLDE